MAPGRCGCPPPYVRYLVPMASAIDRLALMSPAARSALRRERLAVLVLAFVVCSSGLGLRDPWPPDEPRFALIAREMLATGDWLIPRRNGELYSDKPPLFIWLSALAQSATGLRIGFLLPSLTAALATIAMVHDLAARLWGRRPALTAAIALLITGQFAWQARFAQLDMVLVACTTLGLYGIARHLLLGPQWRWWWIGWLGMGLGVMTKGVGFLPALALVPWALARWRRLPGAARVGGSWWRWALGPGLAIAVIACWLVPMLMRVTSIDDPLLTAYRDDILLNQTAKRFVNPDHHFQPFYHYLANAPILWLPLTLALPWLAAPWWRRIRRGDARQWLLVGFAVLVVLFFSLSPGKRGVYIFPALPAVAMAMAPMLAVLIRRPSVAVFSLGLAVTLTVATLAGAAVAAWIELPARVIRRLAEKNVFSADLVVPLSAVGLGAAVVVGFLRQRAVVALVAVVGWAWFAFGWAGHPMLTGRSPRAFMARIETELGASELGMIGWREQYILTATRPLTTFGYAGKVDSAVEEAVAQAWLTAGARRWLLVSTHRASRFVGMPQRRLGYQNGTDWLLIGPIDGATAP